MRRRPFIRTAAAGCAALILTSTAAIAQTTWHVDDDNCPGPGDGSIGNPFCEIEDAVNASASGDTILVDDGVYGVSNVLGINFGGREITIKSINGWYYTRILPTGRAFRVLSGEGPGLIIEGFGFFSGSRVAGSGDDASGGAIAVFNSSPVIRDCYFEDCEADFGGALFLKNSNAQVTGCQFQNNECSGGGGGAIYINGGSPILERCRIFGNGTSNVVADSGGVEAISATLTMINCLVAGNELSGGSNGIEGTNSNINLINCTVVDNDPHNIRLNSGALTALNTILYPIVGDASASVSTSYCVVDSDPGVGDVVGTANFLRIRTGNYELAPGSIAIDRGINDSAAGSIDLNGEARMVNDTNVPDQGSGSGPIVDIGAYERQFPSAQMSVVQVPATFSTIQRGLDYATSTLIVSDGLYKGPGNVNINLDSRQLTVESASGDPTLCIIDCESMPGSGGFICNNGNNSFPLIEGFTVRNANRNLCRPVGGYQVLPCGGGGLVCWRTHATVRNCIFENCFSSGNGGAVVTDDADIILDRCRFIGNSSPLGGAFYSFDSFEDAHPVIQNCTFKDNLAFNIGGAICARSALTVVNSIFTGHNALSYSVLDISQSSVSMINCTIYNNNGATPVEGNGLTMRNCIIAGHAMTPVISGPNANVAYSNIQGGYAGSGNINSLPAFADASNGDFRLLSHSAGIDAGMNSAVPSGIDGKDIADMPRFVDHPGVADTGLGTPPVVDMGAHEWQPGIGPCPSDLTGQNGTPDDTVDVFDLFVLLAQWGFDGPGADLAPPTNVVDVFDLFVMLDAWGPCE